MFSSEPCSGTGASETALIVGVSKPSLNFLKLAFRVGLDSIDWISTWLGILVSILLGSSGPQTHAGPSFLLRKRFGFDRFDHVSVSI